MTENPVHRQQGFERWRSVVFADPGPLEAYCKSGQLNLRGKLGVESFLSIATVLLWMCATSLADVHPNFSYLTPSESLTANESVLVLLLFALTNQP